MFEIEMLPASYGDCIVIQYGTGETCHRVLIDGGLEINWQRLRHRLAQFGHPCELDLLVVTHVDADHIGGIVNGSAFLIVITLPVFIAICVIIKLTSRESIFFSQKRVGYNGRLFNLYKFRTMIEDAEKLKLSLSERNEMDGPVFKIKDDPRITKIGRVLRKTSLDELPQFINVLKGDMSLVGPRPPIPDEVCQYKCPDLRRLSMRPGITCLWQTSGRNKISFEEWMKMDQQYIDQWSLWLDLKILLKTLPAILFQKGAY